MVPSHSVADSFDGLLSEALSGGRPMAMLGPVYRQDPAAVVLEPFRRSQELSGWPAMDADGLAPKWALERAQGLRDDAYRSWLASASPTDISDAVAWTRAGLVLEIASRRGFRYGRQTVRPRWDLNATVTGRFGCSTERVGIPPWQISPLRIAEEHRRNVLPSGPDRRVVVLDFKAMDLCSMFIVVPGLLDRYESLGRFRDPHQRTASLLDVTRDVAKEQLFVHAYGGRSELAPAFEERIPELTWLRRMNDADRGSAARLVQATSARTFRAALSEALPHLVSDAVVPMFVVHDELAIDVDGDDGVALAVEVMDAMERGATAASGVKHTVGWSVGTDYGAAKR